MNKNYYIILSIIFFITGLLFVSIQNELIIIRFNNSNKYESKTNASKKTLKFFYWNNSKWVHEDIDILITNNLENDIQRIVNIWLNLLDEEKLIEKSSLQTTLISNINEVYLSFDRNFLNDESSTYDKLMLIEGLLKTIRENQVPISKIHFLVHHKIMQDSHLDFSNPWLLEGFISQPT